MDKETWTFIFFYGNVLILLIAFMVLVNKGRFKELIPIGLFIAVENYTVEIIGLHYGHWKYPLENPGYPEVTIISSLIYFPIIAMLFYQYLSGNKLKDMLLITCFVSANMIIEIITLKTTTLFTYGEKMNLFFAFLMYLGAYILIILFGNYFNHLHTLKRS
ncbi:CBO0543 family protein [Wukongibacter baidiensis]|uniref:CBO0543 family protein n=1 Tax=Wukongibacter baidiensis TaxID=1723361 RepID=UPI003D7FC146